MSKRLPWGPWYWDDWATATAHLSHAEYSIYHRLLGHYYKTQKPLLANATSLPRLCCAVGSAEIEAMHSVLSQFFELREDGYHNRRADEEIEKTLSISKERQQVGRKGGLAKARNLLKQNRTQSQPHNITPPTPLSGGLTQRQITKISTEMARIAKAMEGANYDLADALHKACTRVGVEFERARFMLGESA